MPCSLCQSLYHNRRSGSCPVNIANIIRRRRHAESRPRSSQSILQQALSRRRVGITDLYMSTGPVGVTGTTEQGMPQPTGPTGRAMNSSNQSNPMLHIDDELYAYMLIYNHMTPRSQYTHYVRRDLAVTYNIYSIYRSVLDIPGQQIIPPSYISADNKVIIRELGANYFTAIGEYDGYNVRRLNLCEIPSANDDILILIPQIPGFNIPEPYVPEETIFEKYIRQMKYEINENYATESSRDNTCAVCLLSFEDKSYPDNPSSPSFSAALTPHSGLVADQIQPEHFVRTPEKRRRSFVGVRGITGDGLPSKVIVHTNCNHVYCSSCISKHIKTQHAKFLDIFLNMSVIPNEVVELPCPLCRTNITKLVFMGEEQRQLMTAFITDEILP